MNDDFLTRYRQVPSPEFSARLYANISRPTPAPFAAARAWAWRLALVVVFVLALGLTFSPAARAAVVHALQDIGGLWFDLAERIQPVDPDQAEIYPVATAQLDAVRQQLPFQFGLPTWLPAGFSLREEVGFASDNSWVLLSFESGDDSISLLVQQDPLYSESKPVPVGSVEEVELNGQPAALIRGNWDLETGEWDPSLPQLSLKWRQGELVYTLFTRSMDLPAEALIRMAESTQ